MKWLPIPSEPGYEACEDGSIRGPSGKILKPGTKKRSGHQYVTVSGKRTRSVHSLVLEAFVGPRPCEPNIVGLHGDDNPANNAISNLSWGTQQKNLQDAYLRGRRITKLCPETVRQIRDDYDRLQVPKRALARDYGVTQRTIQQIVLRRTWTHV